MSRSNPTKPAGNLPDHKTAMPISMNRSTAKIRGSESVPVNANADTNGMVIIYSSKMILVNWSRIFLLTTCFLSLSFCNISIIDSNKNAFSGKVAGNTHDAIKFSFFPRLFFRLP